MTAPEQAPFHTLVKLVEAELSLAEQGRIRELHEAVARTGAYMATLPAPAPESAQPLVLRAQVLRGRVLIVAERLKQSVGRSRLALRRSRRIARKYAGPPSSRYSTTA